MRDLLRARKWHRVPVVPVVRYNRLGRFRPICLAEKQPEERLDLVVVESSGLDPVLNFAPGWVFRSFTATVCHRVRFLCQMADTDRNQPSEEGVPIHGEGSQNTCAPTRGHFPDANG